jgi:hypothetical protein
MVIGILQDQATDCAELTKHVFGATDGTVIGSSKVPVGRVGRLTGEAVMGVASKVVVMME